MPPVSPAATIAFLAIVAAVVSLFIRAYASACERAGGSAARGRAISSLLMAAWLGISGALAARGLLTDFSRLPPPFALMAWTYVAATAALSVSRVGTQLVQHIGIASLIGFQAFRIPVELWLHSQALAGAIPVQMTYAGFNFDIVSGLTAAALGLYARRRAPPRWLMLAWNWLGLALLFVIVTIAALSTPTPLRVFMNEPANTLVAQFPFVWLPAFLVQAALFGHLLVFRWLARERAKSAA